MIFGFLKNLFKQKETSILGIDVGTSSIKIVQLRKKHGKAVLETYGEIALGPYDGKEAGQATNMSAEKISAIVKDLLREAKVTSHSAGVAIPFMSSLISLIELPEAPAEQLQQMVPLEARKYIPVPISEVLLDWSIIPKNNQTVKQTPKDSSPEPMGINKIEVMVVAIHNQTIEKFQEVSKKTGLETKFYEIEMFSSMRSLLPANASETVIIDFGAGSTKVYIIEQGLIRVSHVVRQGGQDISAIIAQSLSVSFAEAEMLKKESDILTNTNQNKAVSDIIKANINSIFAETQQVIVNYEKKYSKKISQGVLIGGGAMLKGIVPMAKEALKIEIRAGDPFTYVEAPAFVAEVLKTKNPEFSVAVGLALRLLQD